MLRYQLSSAIRSVIGIFLLWRCGKHMKIFVYINVLYFLFRCIFMNMGYVHTLLNNLNMYSMMYSFWFSKACQQYDVDVWGPRWLMTGILDQFSLRVHFSSSRKFNSLAVARSCRSFRHSLAVDLPWQNKSIQILAPLPEKISWKLWTGVLWSNCGFATQPGSIKRTSLHARGRN